MAYLHERSMTPLEVLAVLDVNVRGTELPPTLEAAHKQIRDLARALASTDYDGIWISAHEAGNAADWHDYIVDMGGRVPTEETELALRLRSAAR